MARNIYLHSTVSSSVSGSFRAIFPSAPPCGRAFYSQNGFSLLELLLVLFILGLMATSAVLMTQGVEDQSKYDETKRRMEMIKRAIIGDPTRTVNGGPEISGFVADMGRLPTCLRELIDGKCAETDPSPIAWNIDSVTGLGRGWRGPYLDVMPDSDGVARLRDAYGCDWNFQLPASSVEIQSYGMDCLPGGAGNAMDIPQSGVMELIGEDDYLASDSINISFLNPSASDIQISVNGDGVALESASSVVPDIPSSSVQASSMVIPAGGNKEVKVVFPGRITMGTYQLDVDITFPSCGSCVSVTEPYQIFLTPRHHVPSFKWIVDSP